MKLKKLLSVGLAMSIAMASLVGCSSTKEQGENVKSEVVSQENKIFEVLKQAGGADWGMPNPYQHNSRGPGNEANYLMQKFMRATIGTNNVDHCARV